MFTPEEISILIKALGTLDAEYGPRPEWDALLERLRALRDQ